MAKKMTIDELARIIKGEFDGIGAEFKKVDGRFDKLEGELKEIRVDIKGLHKDHEEIELKMSNVAYRFELVELQKRVELLEKKVLKN